MAEPEGAAETTPALKGLAAVFGRPAPTRRQLLLGGGHLAALWALAFVQPLLDLLGKNPDFFVARNNTPGDILILAIGFTLLPPLILLAVEWVVSRISSRAYNSLHLALLTLIAAFILLPLIGGWISARSVIIIAASLVLAAGFAWAIFRSTFVRNLMDILIVAPVVILLLFIFASKANEVIFPGKVETNLATDSGVDRPIVLFIFDELGTDNLMTDRNSIDGDRFPNFARLSREATWYKNQTTNAFFTPKAVPGILTGTKAPPDALPTAQDYPNSLFTLFGGDRPLHVRENVTAVCPTSLCEDADQQSQKARLKSLFSDLKYVEGRLVLPPRMADRLPAVGNNFEGFGNEGSEGSAGPGDPVKRPMVNKFLAGKGKINVDLGIYQQFIREIPASRRALSMLHLHLPHQPWRYAADGRAYNPSALVKVSDSTGLWPVDADGIAESQAKMYTQTGFADELVGELRRKLVKQGLWDDAIVVITADHGVSFQGGDVPRRRVDEQAMGEVANPPLFIKYPGQKKGRTIERHSTTLDIVPTIARAVEANPNYEFDGFPLQNGNIPERPIEVSSLTDHKVTVKLPELITQRNQSIDRANRRLGTGPLYTLGPDSGLIGQSVPPVPPGTVKAKLEQPGVWNNVKPDSSPVAINVTGTLDGTVAPGTLLAIAVNGAIRGTAKAFTFDNNIWFGTLVDPDTLKPGRNEIGIYEVHPAGGLIPLGGNQDQ